MSDFDNSAISGNDLREVAARTYYTIDGLWFLAVEEKYGFDVAFELNQVVWRKAGPIIGARLLKNLDTKGKSPLQVLTEMLFSDPLIFVHTPEVTELTDAKAVFRFLDCPIQVARIRDGKGVYDGIPGCSLLLQAYAELVDPRITTRCNACAPNPDSPEYWCEWVFEIPS
ncbi:MAG: hypothetical protein JSU58_05250 [Dehalococcoidales bacterium]|nr:MAG: hypothetical protein JSU58_05250 [Dehalococcoidales bacterium]